MIHTLDTGYIRKDFDASYLVVEKGRAAFVDTGTSYAAPRLLQALQDQGLDAGAVDYVILTHIHLDHAGGAGALMQQLPQARLVVHPRGAPHMVDPSRLISGATAVYGEEKMSELYGDIVPVPQARVVVADDGFELQLADRPLRCIDTPGHSRHHLCIVDETSSGVFCGDTFGLCYPELATAAGSFMVPTTSPVQFDPEAWLHSLDRLLQLRPQRMYLTHYGAVEDVPRLAGDLRRHLNAYVKLARDCADLSGDARHRALVDGQWLYIKGEYAAAGGVLDDGSLESLLGLDVEINAQGLGVWLDRLRKKS
jgi:glyoxylase-like metal-dependent hydrolase (beta-lactamase superfamily II)